MPPSNHHQGEPFFKPDRLFEIDRLPNFEPDFDPDGVPAFGTDLLDFDTTIYRNPPSLHH